MRHEIIAAAALAAGLAACGGGGMRYRPIEPAEPLARNRLTRIWSIEFRDASGGVVETGASVALNRPFFDIFRDGVARRLKSLKVKQGQTGGTLVGIELTGADVKASDLGAPGVTATVSYAVVVYGGLDAVCRQDATAFAVSREGLAPSPAEDALEKALAKAVDRLGPTIADSCLYTPGPVIAQPKTAEALHIQGQKR